jgi:hypothetical protein
VIARTRRLRKLKESRLFGISVSLWLIWGKRAPEPPLSVAMVDLSSSKHNNSEGDGGLGEGTGASGPAPPSTSLHANTRLRVQFSSPARAESG